MSLPLISFLFYYILNRYFLQRNRTDTYQFDDYSKYVATNFDPVEKAKRRAEVFPLDCEKAFEMGIRFVKRQKAAESQKEDHV
jgi:hypothetical protein